MWYSLARPQADGSDSVQLAALEHARNGWVKATPETPFTFLNGTLAVYAGAPAFQPHASMGAHTRPMYANELTTSWVNAMEPYLSSWSSGRLALQSYLDEWWAFEMTDEQGALRMGKGCSSGHVIMERDTYPRHAVYVTRTDLQGAAEGIYHEYAHLRLRTLGIGIDMHDYRLLLNPPEELYDSSVRFDIKRPMSAVLHGVYAWLMFVENDYQLFAHSDQNDDDVDTFRQYTKHNVPKIQNGIAEIKAHGRFTPEGTEFIQGVYDWADDLCARCTQVYST